MAETTRGCSLTRLHDCLIYSKGATRADYTIEFRVLAAESNWNEAALIPTFLSGLSDAVKDELVSWELQERLDSLFSLAIQVDNHIHEHRREKDGY